MPEVGVGCEVNAPDLEHLPQLGQPVNHRDSPPDGVGLAGDEALPDDNEPTAAQPFNHICRIGHPSGFLMP